MLVATALGSVVVTLVSTVAVQSLWLQRNLEEELSGKWRNERLKELFTIDFRRELTWLPSDVSTIEFPDDPSRLVEVMTLSSRMGSSAVHDPRLPAQVAYLLERSAQSGTAVRLVRDVRFLTESGDTHHREVLGVNVRKATLTQFSDDQWKTLDSTESKRRTRPKALRLELAFGSDDEELTVTAPLRDRPDGNHDR